MSITTTPDNTAWVIRWKSDEQGGGAVKRELLVPIDHALEVLGTNLKQAADLSAR